MQLPPFHFNNWPKCFSSNNFSLNQHQKIKKWSGPTTRKEKLNFFLCSENFPQQKERNVNCESGLSEERGQSIIRWKYTKVIFRRWVINCPQRWAESFQQKAIWEKNTLCYNLHSFIWESCFRDNRILIESVNCSWVSQAKAKQKRLFMVSSSTEQNYFQSEPQW